MLDEHFHPKEYTWEGVSRERFMATWWPSPFGCGRLTATPALTPPSYLWQLAPGTLGIALLGPLYTCLDSKGHEYLASPYLECPAGCIPRQAGHGWSWRDVCPAHLEGRTQLSNGPLQAFHLAMHQYLGCLHHSLQGSCILTLLDLFCSYLCFLELAG